MATVCEGYTTEEQRSVVPLCVFLWAIGLSSRDTHEGLLFTVASVCRVKRSQMGGTRFADVVEVGTEVRKWLRQQSEDFCAAGFDAPAHRQSDGTSVSVFVEGMSRSKCYFFWFEYRMCYVLYPFVSYLPTPLYMCLSAEGGWCFAFCYEALGPVTQGESHTVYRQ
jgi:hypothetical protein